MAEISDAEYLKRIKAQFPDDAEAKDILAYDRAIERGEKPDGELTAEQKKVVKDMRKVGRAPTAYKFTARERKPNEAKAELMKQFMECVEHIADSAELVNAERQIAFSLGGKNYELTLVEKRAKN